MISIGGWSFGLALCVVGLALLWQNLTGTAVAGRLLRFWGAIPLLFGLELLAAWYRSRRRAGEPLRMRLHGGSVAGLAALLVVAMVANLGPVYARHWGNAFVWSPLYTEEATATLSESLPAGDTVTALTSPDPLPGDWTITGTDAGEVAATFELSARAATADKARAAAEGAKIKLWVEGGSVRVSLEVPGYDSTRPRPETMVYGTGTLTIPRRLHVTAAFRSGSATFDGLDGNLNVTVAAGDVTVRRSGGSVELAAASGRVVVEDAAGDVGVTAASGSVEITRAGGDVSVVAASGPVRVTDPERDVHVETASGDSAVSSTVPLGGNWTVRAASGDIRVTLPKGANARVTAEARSGSVSSDLGLAVRSAPGHNSMEGTLGKGAYSVTLDAVSGSISVTGAGP